MSEPTPAAPALPADRTRDALRRAAAGGARHLADALRRALAPPPRYVHGYRGYGTAERALVLGRALVGVPNRAAEVGDSRWRNLLDTLRRIQRDPVPHARVHGTLQALSFAATADDEGFVRAWVPVAAPLAAGEWHPVGLALDDDAREAERAGDEPAATTPSDGARGAERQAATASVLVPSASARFGIISDLDDTVLQSDATRLLRAARLMLLENARTRLPFPGVAALYRALVGGASGADANPVFYVSSSPWNLYDVVADFLDLQDIPAGPLLLRDWDLGRELAAHGGHKRQAIDEILATYPDLRFVLVGDSGQEDPEIYRGVVHDHPGRVLAVYIRSVHHRPARAEAVRALAAEVEAAGSVLLLADDSRTMAAHAAALGLVTAAAVDGVEVTATLDAARPETPDDAADEDDVLAAADGAPGGDAGGEVSAR